MSMKRLLLKELISWKNQPIRKPILLDGARQVGKSYLLTELFGKHYFRNHHVIDFYEDPKAHLLFDESLEPSTLLKRLSLYLGTDIDPLQDLIIFDEVGECERALNSLKYFAEQQPDWSICSSGSNIGLLKSFPVGKVSMMTLRPLNFKEFLLAIGSQQEIEAYTNFDRSKIAHAKLWSHLVDYLFVGGLPEAVNYWVESQDEPILKRRNQVRQIQREIIGGFERDFGKYAGQVNALHIGQVFKNVSQQLEKSLQDQTKRYTFKNVIPKKSSYRDFANIISWLETTYLVSKNYLIGERPRVPIKAYAELNRFKLFHMDVGLLCRDLGIPESTLSLGDALYKGPIIENFVQNELLSYGHPNTYSWSENTAQVEFILESNKGFVPLEVKSGKNTKSQSLSSFKDRYEPDKTAKLIGAAGGTDTKNIVLPLYYVEHLLHNLNIPNN